MTQAASPSTAPPPSDVDEIEAAARDYIEGWYAGDVARMDRALHDELAKRTLVADSPPGESDLRTVTKARMVEMTAQGGGEQLDPDFEILIDDISVDIASARVTSPEYLDYLQLAKTAAGWKIVNVLFHVRN